MKFGASIWPFHWDAPYEEGIRRIAGLGFKAVELIAWNREMIDTYYTPATIRSLRNVAQSEGIEISEFVSTPHGLANPDKARREQAVDHFKRTAEIAVELGTKIVNSVSVYPFELSYPWITDMPHLQEFKINIPSGLDWQRNWEDYVESTRQCAVICEQANLKFALEPHPFRYMSNTASMLRLIEHVKSDALGMNFDPSHLFPVGEIPHQVIYQLGNRIFHCHFSDNDGTTNVHWRPGKGKIDWEAVLRALKDTGYDGVISLEFEDVPGVSRGARSVPGVVKEKRVATPEFDRENLLAVQYLRSIGETLDIHFEK
ncbi:MAG TPA: sugar phosphate isomerase/epimerase family protein [Ktedonobacteraceae bacterium]|jgi:sugar phosphate isomerase/epimerase|nr:sugar phosphate isomerase/epimerase family protein [Ktedonobacteraceae bacterium]